MGPLLGDPGHQRQDRRRALQGLGFLVDAEHDGLVRRVS
jgi:hypothetical protein